MLYDYEDLADAQIQAAYENEFIDLLKDKSIEWVKPETWQVLPAFLSNAQAMQVIKDHSATWSEYVSYCLAIPQASTRSTLCLFDFLGYSIDEAY